MKITMPEPVRLIISRLAAAGYDAYAVGGCIRDSIRGEAPNDWDICTEALPETVEDVFKDMRIVETGLQHGTVTLIIDHKGYEITTYRTEGAYSDRRKPDYVEFVKDLREDVKRRDFTINAMAYNDKNGLQDHFGGIEDLKAGVIRCVGDANERFNEDALRILRAMRFAATFDFEIDEGTANAMHSNKSLLSYISKERISVELMKLLKGSGAARILREFADIVTEIIPEIAPCIGLEQNKIYHKFDVWEHTLSAIDNAERDSIIRLAVLLHDIGKPECYAETETGIHFYGHPETGASIADEILHRLKMSNDIISTVCTLVKYHASYLGITSGGLKRLLNKIGIENARLLLKVAYADMSAHSDGAMIETRASLEFVKSELDRIEENNECFKVTQLAVNGKDMIALGFKGQEIGEKLNMLLEAVIDGKAENERDALIAFLKK